MFPRGDSEESLSGEPIIPADVGPASEISELKLRARVPVCGQRGVGEPRPLAPSCRRACTVPKSLGALGGSPLRFVVEESLPCREVGVLNGVDAIRPRPSSAPVPQAQASRDASTSR